MHWHSSPIQTSVLVFWSSEVSPHYAIRSLIIKVTVTAFFGAVHCTAWNSHFPSLTETIMWKVTSGFIAVWPLSAGILTWGSHILDRRYFNHRGFGHRELDWLTALTLIGGIPLYIISRLTLIVLPIITLRDLQLAVFQDVDWTVWHIPHI
ncbi:hypothetical protein C8J56DRAFT_916657 [Mycena floridula]|nr:hypothetical protein C8J56DRAFT_916657 [Mycena floridula]